MLEEKGDSIFSSNIQSINISVDLGREKIFELGRKQPYKLFAEFPVKINEDNMQLTLEQYQEFVAGLLSSFSRESYKDMLATAALGLTGEAGECADLVKKHLYHGSEFKREEFISELGDVLWYVAHACNTLEVSIQSVINRNVAKLQSRYTTGQFSKEEFEAKERAKERDNRPLEFGGQRYQS